MCSWGGASWDGWRRQGLGERVPLEPCKWIGFHSMGSLPLSPPPRGGRQSQTKKGINKKGGSWRTEDLGRRPPFHCPVPGRMGRRRRSRPAGPSERCEI